MSEHYPDGQGQGELFRLPVDPSEQPTEEFEPVAEPLTRRQRLGQAVLRGLESFGRSYTYGSARMGVYPLPPYEQQNPESTQGEK